MPQIQVTHAQTSVPSPLRPLVYASSPPYVHACLSVTEVFNSGSISYFSSPLHSKCVHVTLFSLHLCIFFLSILTTSTVISKCAYVTLYNRLFYVHFLSLRYPYMHLYVHLFHTHTHTRRSASVHSISIDRVLLCHHVHCSVHWFHPPVSASLHPSSFRPATHLFFHLRWKNLRLFQNVLNLSVSRPLSPPSIIHLFVLSPVLHPYINVSILNWFSTQQCCISSIFSQFLHPHLQNISINAPCVPHFTPSSHHPLIFSSICAGKPAFVPYICILIRVWCWFSIQCASFHPFYPDLCIPHLKYLISTCLTSIYSSFIDTNHPYFLPFTLECLYVIHKSIC